MKNLLNYIKESIYSEELTSDLMPLLESLEYNDNITIEECLSTYDNIDDYVDEEFINEGLVSFVKSLFSSGARKKYHDAYDEWLKETEDAKKYKEEQERLKKEFNDKKKQLLDKIKNAKTDEEIAKAYEEYDNLIAKKEEAETKIKEENKKVLKNAPDDVKTALKLSEVSELLDYVQMQAKGYSKANKQRKQRIIELLNEKFKAFSEKLAKSSDDAKKQIQDTFKEAKTDDYIQVSGDAVTLKQDGFIAYAKSLGKVKASEDGTIDTKNKTPEDVKKEITATTKETLKDNVDPVKNIITATGVKIKSDQLIKIVSSIINNGGKDTEIKIDDNTLVSISTILLGVLSAKASSNEFNKTAVQRMIEWMIDNYENITLENITK